MSKKTKEFKTEVQQLLHLVIHSLYSHKEIFLRELISNASDAIDRARFLSVSGEGVDEPEGGWGITLRADKEARTLTISDTGVGMTREEIDINIGTIAKSGTKAFLEQLQEAEAKERPELIGQFGVGFYSAFMVADAVSLTTKSARSDEDACSWSSDGTGQYTVDDAERDGFGTSITLHLKEGEDEFFDEHRLRGLVKQYSDYIAFPIRLDTPDAEPDEDGNIPEPEVLNAQQALWLRPKNEITDEDYQQFYKSTSHDWNPPATTLHWTAEGVLEFTALLFLPSKAPFDLYHDMDPKGIGLYVKRVFIMNDCKDLLPPWLRFVKGVVDCSDLSLNVSRELLQKDPRITMLRKNLVKKVLSALKEMLAKDRKAYESLWDELGKVLKEGIHADPESKEKLSELLLFRSSRAEGWTTLKELEGRLQPGQKSVYYITGEDVDAVTKSPHLEAFNARNIEVLYLTDPVDEWVAQGLEKVGELPLVSVDKGELDLDDEETKEANKAEREEQNEEYKDVLAALKTNLEEEVEDVRLTDRLTDSACVLVASDAGMGAHMERLMASMGQGLPASKRVLELNPGHPIMGKLKALVAADVKADAVKDYADLLYGQGLISEGSHLKDPLRFTQLVSKLMANA